MLPDRIIGDKTAPSNRRLRSRTPNGHVSTGEMSTALAVYRIARKRVQKQSMFNLNILLVAANSDCWSRFSIDSM